MAESKSHLVLALFDNETAADRAAEALKSWDKSNDEVKAGAVGVLVRDKNGKVKEHKVGPRETGRGLGIGAVLGLLAAIPTGGASLVALAGGVVSGGVVGSIVGTFFHHGLHLSEEDASRLGRELDSGRAAVGVLGTDAEAKAFSDKLRELGGQPESHEMDRGRMQETAATVGATGAAAGAGKAGMMQGQPGGGQAGMAQREAGAGQAGMPSQPTQGVGAKGAQTAGATTKGGQPAAAGAAGAAGAGRQGESSKKAAPSGGATTTLKANTDPAIVQAAADAYVYGYPLVYDLQMVEALVKGSDTFPVKATPYNRFACARDLLGPETKFVSPNNDTLYMLASCDVRDEPLMLHVPDSHGHYYVLQFVDAWTNNFAYVGTRSTGTGEGDYLLVAPGYSGEVPHRVHRIEVPTGVFSIVGRIQVDGASDLAAVRKLQDGFKLTPMSVHQGRKSHGTPAGVPKPDSGVSDDLMFWERLRVALAAFPPDKHDHDFIAECAKVGLTDKKSPYVHPDEKMRTSLVQAEKVARARIDEMVAAGAMRKDNWDWATHMFDYNVDHLGLGTIDSPKWKIPDRVQAYVTRATAARAGLWGNHGYEADYAVTHLDAAGEELTGSSAYELHLPSEPPVDAFWSLTMYDTPHYHLVENAMHRYSIGDRTPGLRKDADGSITIYVGHDSPGKDKESNWLPAPEGAFRPIFRMYAPKKAILEGTYRLPAFTKVKVPAQAR